MRPVDRMAQLCCVRNRIVNNSYKNGDMQLSEFIKLQANKASHNLSIKPIMDSEDFASEAEKYVAGLISDEAAKKVRNALKYRAVCTADHHGGLFCSQTFQGNILFGEILRELGSGEGVIPVLSAGQVELSNSTFAKGICAYTNPDKKELMPIFPEKPKKLMAISAPAIDKVLLSRFRDRFLHTHKLDTTQRAVDEILSEIYESDYVLESDRFGTQVTKIGSALSERLFGEEGIRLVYLEMESILTPLLIKELQEGTSLVAKAILDDEFIKIMSGQIMEDGTTVADYLFRAIDEKGQKLSLKMRPGAVLEGRNLNGEVFSYKADKDGIIGLLTEGKIIPGVFTMAAMSFFERGITWMGGAFQAIYLPMWQEKLVEILSITGMKKEADLIKGYDCTGYLCGPMYALYGDDKYLMTAGPLEFWIRKPGYEKVRTKMLRTRLFDAHLIGLSEMYFDLTSSTEREDGWYRMIARDLGTFFRENEI